MAISVKPFGGCFADGAASSAQLGLRLVDRPPDRFLRLANPGLVGFRKAMIDPDQPFLLAR